MSKKLAGKVSLTADRDKSSPNRQVNAATGICFFRVTADISLKKFLSELQIPEIQISGTPELAEEWLHFGSLYLDGLRQRQDVSFMPGQLLRLHTRRKNYWSDGRPLAPLIVLQHPQFLVLDKPSGLPTHPTLDNYVENAQILLEQELQQQIYVTHRLDVATQGLLILAKTPESQRGINRLFSRGRVLKKYRAITSNPVEVGLHTHYMDPQGRVPREVTNSPQAENWWGCRLEVEACQRLPNGLYCSDIHLLTGKTHQIRAQFKFMGAPIVGDAVYGSDREFEGIGLECFSLSFQLGPETFTVTRPASIAK